MEQDSLAVGIGMPIALFVIMTGIGLTLTPGDFRRELRSPRALAAGSVGQLAAVPLLGLLLVLLFRPPPEIAVGLVIVAALPGGTMSNLCAFLGRGNVALSVVLTVAASLAAVATLPLWTLLALEQDVGAVVPPPGETVGRMLATVVAPVLLGMAVRYRLPALAARIERPFSVAAGAGLGLMVLGVALALREDIPDYLHQAGLVVVLLNLGGAALGWLLGAAIGAPRRDRLTLALELGMKNAALGMLIGGTLLGDFGYAVPSAVYGAVMFGPALVLAAYGRRTLPPAR
ncbi:bile acid:sodium symporter family protein [Nocardiopsis potens]|uniref:bile acid:sodium symporter family protein n=1 Tax=Nocardiopsis potens TaxID=1246458 RepID=UPI0003469679|nr:bile acid:sodium symporter family protein [Nocardiopsis potens]